MNELTRILLQLAQVGILIGAVALGFGIVLKGVSEKSSAPVVRFGLFTAGGSLLIYVVAMVVR